MKKMLLLAVLVGISGCRSVPANVAVNMETHYNNTETLYSELRNRLREELNAIDVMLATIPGESAYVEKLRDNKDDLKRLLMLAGVDIKLAAQIKDWGLKFSNPDEVARIRAEREAIAGN